MGKDARGPEKAEAVIPGAGLTGVFSRSPLTEGRFAPPRLRNSASPLPSYVYRRKRTPDSRVNAIRNEEIAMRP
ncbi:MAG: hypothetical protein OEM19_03090, partial [Deltaproteobacteria bacterium]|nr:hypothetical protein [Deltaproteobacteria bacterium]